MIESILLIVGAYILGSIPTGYLIARYVGGIDIRDYGSGNVGASNVMIHVGRKTGFAQGLFDCLIKGAAPVLIGKLIDVDLWVQGTAGFAAVAAHSWSPYLKFTGGRGVATAIGVAFGLLMWRETLVVAAVVLLLRATTPRDAGLWTFIAIVGIPVMSLVFRQPTEIVLTTICIGLLLMTKRLTANWESPPAEYPVRQVLGYRLLLDRDVPRKAEWTGRRPR